MLKSILLFVALLSFASAVEIEEVMEETGVQDIEEFGNLIERLSEVFKKVYLRQQAMLEMNKNEMMPTTFVAKTDDKEEYEIDENGLRIRKKITPVVVTAAPGVTAAPIATFIIGR